MLFSTFPFLSLPRKSESQSSKDLLTNDGVESGLQAVHGERS